MFVGARSHYGEMRLLPYMRLCELHHYGGTLLCCQRDDLDWQDTRLWYWRLYTSLQETTSR